MKAKRKAAKPRVWRGWALVTGRGAIPTDGDCHLIIAKTRRDAREAMEPGEAIVRVEIREVK